MQFLGGRTYGVSYVQDGQASTNAIFGTVGNSAPGLDAIAEVQVLSNSYSAEYGGLAGVVVTTKRGGNRYNGTTFYDFNSDGLNALTYAQKAARGRRATTRTPTPTSTAGARASAGRSSPTRPSSSRTTRARPRRRSTAAARVNVPTAAMRAGDFSGTTIVVKDPLTGLAVPGQRDPVEPARPLGAEDPQLLLPAAEPGHARDRHGRLPAVRARRRATASARTCASTTRPRSKDSLFLRASYQRRDPAGISFEAGNGADEHAASRTRTLDTATVVAGWTKIFSNTVVNEFRVGYNYDNSVRQSQYNVQRGQRPARPRDRAERRRLPRRLSRPSASRADRPPAGPSNITDGGFNVDRTINQNSFSISDNLSWVVGSHSLRGGALWTRNTAIDGRGRGINHRGQYRFNGAKTGNALADLLLGYTRDVADRVSDARRHRRLLERLRGLRCRTTGGSTTT